MCATTNSFGEVRRGRVWFTTSPKELCQPKARPLPRKRVVVRKRNGEKIRIERNAH